MSYNLCRKKKKINCSCSNNYPFKKSLSTNNFITSIGVSTFCKIFKTIIFSLLNYYNLHIILTYQFRHPSHIDRMHQLRKHLKIRQIFVSQVFCHFLKRNKTTFIISIPLFVPITLIVLFFLPQITVFFKTKMWAIFVIAPI